MSAHTRKHHTSSAKSANILYVIDNEVLYAIPKKIADKYLVETRRAVPHEGNVSAEEVFARHDKKIGKAAALLKGLRARENMSQVEFAKKIKVSQANLSKMENGSRPIGKTIAKRIEKAFSVNHKYFIE